MDLSKAIDAHGEWKVKFRQAINGKERLDAVTIAADNCCNLGQWLHGEAKTKFGHLKSYAECVDKHAAFHKSAGNVAQTINAKKYAEAESMISVGSDYLKASVAVSGAIFALKKETGL